MRHDIKQCLDDMRSNVRQNSECGYSGFLFERIEIYYSPRCHLLTAHSEHKGLPTKWNDATSSVDYGMVVAPGKSITPSVAAPSKVCSM